MSGTWLYGGVKSRRKSSGKSSGKSSSKEARKSARKSSSKAARKSSGKARAPKEPAHLRRRTHLENARKERKACLQQPAGSKKPSCRQVSHQQAKRISFMTRRDGYERLDAIGSGGRLSRKDLKRVKGGRYFLATEPKVSAGFLAWQRAVKIARRGFEGVFTPQRTPTEAHQNRRSFYDQSMKVYQSLRNNKEIMASLEAKALEKNRAVEKHNRSVHLRTASNGGRTTAKFLAWRDAVKHARSQHGFPKKIVPNHDGSPDQKRFYLAANAQYKLIRGDESRMQALEQEATSMNAKRSRKLKLTLGEKK
jgi:hypothetical protein